MRGPAARVALLGAAAALLVTGCAGRRVVDGVFHAPAGYRVSLPGPEWEPAGESGADLELRHRSAPAGMLAHAHCDAAAARRRLDVLARHLLLGLRDRRVLERDQVPVDGRPAAHRVLEGRMPDRGGRVRIESYVFTDGRCVYDLLYVAAPEAFDAWRPAFQRFVESFGRE